ncbi:hypothetical protein JHK84_027112 [Glycine max]|nr:hypothetical protein JHK84_027112 [Glycine max]
MLEELEAEGVDTSFFVVSKEGTSPFSYVIVDNQTKTRTCIFTPGYPEMVPQDLPRANLLSALDGARMVYFDARMPDSALVIAQEPVTKLRAKGIEESVCGRLYYGASEKIPPSELMDTTGAGDAFVGAVLYAICANISPEKMLPLASYVAAANCRALGARRGLPYSNNPCLASFTE